MRILFTAVLATGVITATPSLAQNPIVCRFQSIEDSAGKTPVSGTVVRTVQAAILEHDGDVAAVALTCPISPFQCEAKTQESITIVDFSYPGFMVLVFQYPAIGMTLTGLARMDCS